MKTPLFFILFIVLCTGCATNNNNTNYYPADVATYEKLIHHKVFYLSDFADSAAIDCLTQYIEHCPTYACGEKVPEHNLRPVIYRPSPDYIIDLREDVHLTIGLSVNPAGKVIATRILDNIDTLPKGVENIQKNVHSYRFTPIDSSDCLEHGIIAISIGEKK